MEDDIDLEELEELYGNVDDLEINSDLESDLLNKIAMIMLVYLISNEYMKMSYKEKATVRVKISTLVEKSINADLKSKKDTMLNVLKNINWSNPKELIKVINTKTEDKTWMERLVKNKSDTGKQLMKITKDFLNGKISVNDIKDKLTKIIKYDLYKDKRLLENEISRVTNTLRMNKFKRDKVKKVRRNAILGARTCEECVSEDGTVYPINEAPSLPSHIKCRCYWEKVE